MVRSRFVWALHIRSTIGQKEKDKARRDEAGHGKTMQGTTRQDKAQDTAPHKTRQDKTRRGTARHSTTSHLLFFLGGQEGVKETITEKVIDGPKQMNAFDFINNCGGMALSRMFQKVVP
jgi:hypothetical protein